MFTFQTLLVSSLIMFLAACSGGGGAVSSSPSTDGGGSGGGGGGGTSGTSSYGLEKGTYEMACPQPGSSASMRIIVEQSIYKIVDVRYDSSTTGCSQIEKLTTFQYSATSPGASSTVSGAVDLNLTFTKYTIKPMTAAVVSDLNTQQTCGISNWSLNTEVDVTATSCAATITSPMYTIAKVANNILQIGFSVNGTADDGTTSGQRNSMLAPIDLLKQ